MRFSHLGSSNMNHPLSAVISLSCLCPVSAPGWGSPEPMGNGVLISPLESLSIGVHIDPGSMGHPDNAACASLCCLEHEHAESSQVPGPRHKEGRVRSELGGKGRCIPCWSSLWCLGPRVSKRVMLPALPCLPPAPRVPPNGTGWSAGS